MVKKSVLLEGVTPVVKVVRSDSARKRLDRVTILLAADTFKIYFEFSLQTSLLSRDLLLCFMWDPASTFSVFPFAVSVL